MSNTPHTIRPGMTGDMGVTPDTSPSQPITPRTDAEDLPVTEETPKGEIKNPMDLPVDPSPNPVDPADGDKA